MVQQTKFEHEVKVRSLQIQHRFSKLLPPSFRELRGSLLHNDLGIEAWFTQLT